jgi:hypothetical protein
MTWARDVRLGRRKIDRAWPGSVTPSETGGRPKTTKWPWADPGATSPARPSFRELSTGLIALFGAAFTG